MADRKGVVNVERRTWDKAEAQAKADALALSGGTLDDGAAKPKPVPAQERTALKPREGPLEIDSKVGTKQVVTAASALAQQGGFFCDACQCLLKDSLAYLDHVNGKKHQRMLGMTMRAPRASLDDVKSRLRKGVETPAEKAQVSATEWEEKLKRKREEEERILQAIRDKKKVKEQPAEDPDMDPEMAKMMGFGGFGSSKKT